MGAALRRSAFMHMRYQRAMIVTCTSACMPAPVHVRACTCAVGLDWSHQVPSTTATCWASQPGSSGWIPLPRRIGTCRNWHVIPVVLRAVLRFTSDHFISAYLWSCCVVRYYQTLPLLSFPFIPFLFIRCRMVRVVEE